ncbi:helix-turn-helix domain-containing protein [Micromonosporaceae bacterium Da 78-11]
MPLPNSAAIKAIRLAKRLTGVEVAAACNISHGHLFNLENPERRKHASKELLANLAVTLGVPVAAIEMPAPPIAAPSRRRLKQAA